jgi:hypothetical protein
MAEQESKVTVGMDVEKKLVVVQHSSGGFNVVIPFTVEQTMAFVNTLSNTAIALCSIKPTEAPGNADTGIIADTEATLNGNTIPKQ